MRFRAELRQSGKTATGIRVPDEIVAALGSKRPPVRVTINGHSYRSTIASMKGEFMLPVSAEHRLGAGIAAGDALTVDVELDTEPRLVTVPPDFAAALGADDVAKKFFDGLSYSHQRAYLTWIEDTKKAETRQRRIDQTVGMLHEGRRR
jgi:Bacteriocin-protection, YdeI or OmpD-Associated/Domain of unknown function (DUF1905)